MYRLSKLIPVHFTTRYRIGETRMTSSWWQWRGRIFRHVATPA